jgi:hypothetical protein
MTLRLDSRRLLIGSTFILLSGLVGCSIFDERIEPTLTAQITTGGETSSADGDPASGDPASQFTVELRSASGKSEGLARPLTGQLSVQEALEQTRAAKKFKRFNLELYRPLSGGRWHRMVLEYDRAGRRVPPETDYSLLPGDRLVVVEDATTVIDDVVNGVLNRAGMDPLTKTPQQQVAARYRVGD